MIGKNNNEFMWNGNAWIATPITRMKNLKKIVIIGRYSGLHPGYCLTCNNASSPLCEFVCDVCYERVASGRIGLPAYWINDVYKDIYNDIYKKGKE